MNQDWQAFLGSRALRQTQADVSNANFVAPLHADGLLLARGEEVADFLQGQFGNDLREVDDQHSQLSGYSSPKGRLLALFRVLHREDGYLLRLPRDIQEETLKRLRMFVMRAKVEFVDGDDSLACFGVSGEKAAAALSEQLGSLPGIADNSTHIDGIDVLRVASTQPRFELYGAPEALAELWQALAEAGCAEHNSDAWRLADIAAGLPNIYAATRDAFVAQMVNLQLINGLSFKKGCYPGQEIVARMQYLGQLKRRMYRFDIDTDSAPAPGDELFNAEGKPAGVIVDAVATGEGRSSVLAVLRIEHADQTLLLGSAEGPAAHPAALPYAFAD